jgi:hypothetical protein
LPSNAQGPGLDPWYTQEMVLLCILLSLRHICNLLTFLKLKHVVLLVRGFLMWHSFYS